MQMVPESPGRRSRSPARVAAVASLIWAFTLTPAGGKGAATSLRRNCTAVQLRLTGQLSGATQSLLGTLTVRNRSERTCALPAAPRRVSIYLGRQLLPTLTVRLRGSRVPPGTPTRTLPGRGRVVLGLQWRNWCGAPRGSVRASLVLTIAPGVAARLALGTVTTPPCLSAKYSSTVAVSRFLRP